MEKDIKQDTSFDYLQPSFSNTNFEIDMNNFADRKDNNQSKVNSLKSTNSFSTGQNPIYNYHFGSEQFSSDEIQDISYKNLKCKNFIRKSSLLTEETQENSEQLENSSNYIQTPKKFEEKKDEEKIIRPSENKLFNSPSLLIMEKMVGNESYALYQNLENYSFSIVRYTLKKVKDYSKCNKIIFRNNAYLDDVNPNKKKYQGKVNDIINNFKFYMNYLALIGTYGIFYVPSYWNINNINK